MTSLLPGQTTTLTATPSPATIGSSTIATTWFHGANSIINASNSRLINVDSLGDYQVKIRETWTSGLVCPNESAIVTIAATVSAKLFIFPSPNDGQFTVAYYNAGGTTANRTITIYNTGGARIYTSSFPIAGPYTLLHIDVRPASTGIYYVVVGDASGKKLIRGKVLVH